MIHAIKHAQPQFQGIALGLSRVNESDYRLNGFYMPHNAILRSEFVKANRAPEGTGRVPNNLPDDMIGVFRDRILQPFMGLFRASEGMPLVSRENPVKTPWQSVSFKTPEARMAFNTLDDLGGIDFWDGLRGKKSGLDFFGTLATVAEQTDVLGLEAQPDLKGKVVEAINNFNPHRTPAVFNEVLYTEGPYTYNGYGTTFTLPLTLKP